MKKTARESKARHSRSACPRQNVNIVMTRRHRAVSHGASTDESRRASKRYIAAVDLGTISDKRGRVRRTTRRGVEEQPRRQQTRRITIDESQQRSRRWLKTSWSRSEVGSAPTVARLQQCPSRARFPAAVRRGRRARRAYFLSTIGTGRVSRRSVASWTHRRSAG